MGTASMPRRYERVRSVSSTVPARPSGNDGSSWESTVHPSWPARVATTSATMVQVGQSRLRTATRPSGRPCSGLGSVGADASVVTAAPYPCRERPWAGRFRSHLRPRGRRFTYCSHTRTAGRGRSGTIRGARAERHVLRCTGLDAVLVRERGPVRRQHLVRGHRIRRARPDHPGPGHRPPVLRAEPALRRAVPGHRAGHPPALGPRAGHPVLLAPAGTRRAPGPVRARAGGHGPGGGGALLHLAALLPGRDRRPARRGHLPRHRPRSGARSGAPRCVPPGCPTSGPPSGTASRWETSPWPT